MTETVLLRTACGCRRLMLVRTGDPLVKLTLPISTASLAMRVEVREFVRTDLTEDFCGSRFVVYGENR